MERLLHAPPRTMHERCGLDSNQFYATEVSLPGASVISDPVALQLRCHNLIFGETADGEQGESMATSKKLSISPAFPCLLKW